MKTSLVNMARSMTTTYNASKVAAPPLKDITISVTAGSSRLLSSQRTARAAALGAKDDKWPASNDRTTSNSKPSF